MFSSVARIKSCSRAVSRLSGAVKSPFATGLSLRHAAAAARAAPVPRTAPVPDGPTALLAWGSDSASALGNGSYDLFRSAIRPIILPPNAYAPAAAASVDSASAADAPGAAASANAVPTFAEPESVVDVATGWSSSLAVTSSGAVYQWGSMATLRDTISAAMFRGRTPKVFRAFQNLTFMGRMANRSRAPRPVQMPLFGAKTLEDLAKKVGDKQVRKPTIVLYYLLNILYFCVVSLYLASKHIILSCKYYIFVLYLLNCRWC